MQPNTQQKTSKKQKSALKSATPDTFAHAETSPAEAETVGRFNAGELGDGEAKVTRSGERVLITFEFSFPETTVETSGPADVLVDVVIGPVDWQPGAEVFEIRSVPVLANSAIAEVSREDLARIAQNGRVQFYGKIQTGLESPRYLNRDGRPFENFELTL